MTALTLLLQEEKHVRERIAHPPTPKWLDRFMEWALQEVPQVVQQMGGVAGIVMAAVVAALVVWKRRQIVGWWRRRSAVFKRMVLAVVAVCVIAIAGTGLYVSDYVQHDNDFCNSCHVMLEPFEKFQQSEHSELGCHDCHRQSTAASMRQLYLWVANRPEDIGPHAPVPTGVCAECHVVDDPDSTWQRISATVGHRVHLEADTSALKGVMCVTCHGKEVHRFRPADETCGQSGCHETDKTQIVLGDMAGQTGFHCVTCHEFTAPVAEEAPLDTVRVALVPALENCRSCHEMEKVLVGLDPAVDPHDAVCGTCHNPHTQEAPAVATNRCAECHAPAETLTPFHRGLRSAVLENCVGCHAAHTFRVKGEDCLACHADILGGTPSAGPHREPHASSTREREKPASAFLGPGTMDLIPVSLVDLEKPAHSHPRLSRAIIEQYVALRMGTISTSTSVGESGAWSEPAQQQPPFDHRAHRNVGCTSCHSMERSHGEITLASRRECSECHHTRPVVNRGCQSCHQGPEVIGVKSVTVSMRLKVWEGARSRELPFDHAEHAALTCSACHTGGPQLAAQRACADCHQDHHEADRDCTACHRKPSPAAHTIAVHTQGCSDSSCHGPESYGKLGVGRNTCLACHQDLGDHRSGRACAACHQVSPVSRASFGGSP